MRTFKFVIIGSVLITVFILISCRITADKIDSMFIDIEGFEMELFMDVPDAMVEIVDGERVTRAEIVEKLCSIIKAFKTNRDEFRKLANIDGFPGNLSRHFKVQADYFDSQVKHWEGVARTLQIECED